MKNTLISVVFAALFLPLAAAQAAEKPENREVLFGETHLHTLLSFDSYIFGNRNTPDGSYVRQAYLRGLEMAAQGKGNPYRFGMIGASDTHVGAGAFDEDNYWSKVGLVDSNARLRGSVPPRPDVEVTIQERAYSSPIWVN